MKITTERRIRLAENKIAMLKAKIAELRSKDSDAPELVKEVEKLNNDKSIVGKIIEARFVQQFEGDLYIPMIVEAEFRESFSAKCLNKSLPNGYTQMAFLKNMKNKSWR